MACGSAQRHVSSGSDGGDLLLELEERKRKRMLSNRESARRSRMRKQKQIEDLTEEAGSLKSHNDRLKQEIKAMESAYAEMQAANDVVKAQTNELTERLGFLNSMVKKAEDANARANEMVLFRAEDANEMALFHAEDANEMALFRDPLKVVVLFD